MTPTVRWPRPLDPVRSIKAKLGLLVVGSTTAGVASIWLSLVVLHWRGRWGALAAVLVTLGLTLVLAHGMTSPLRQMTRAVQDMAAGRPAAPVRATSRDEVGELARAFTAMAADLATADAQRRDLLANVAHELRTPVAALRAQLENLVDGVRDPDPAALTDLLLQAERLGTLVDDLLDLARAEGGATPLRRLPVPVAELAGEVAAQVRAARPGPLVRVTVPAGLRADADPDRLRQVLTNLVDNAAQHAGAAGTVEVRAAVDAAGGLVLEVGDDGPGIPADRHEAVFERFRHGPGSHGSDGSDGGTGLGLAIARWAVALHGGRIAVVPTPSGCLIRAHLPAGAVDAVSADTAPVENQEPR